jgi:VanZ family protein
MRPLRHLQLYLGLGLTYVTFIIVESLVAHPLQPLPPFPNADKLEHLVAYGLMMGWFGQLARERRLRAGLAVAFIVLGGLMELLQGAMALGRSMEFGDFAADILGVWLGHVATQQGGGQLLAWLEQKIRR